MMMIFSRQSLVMVSLALQQTFCAHGRLFWWAKANIGPGSAMQLIRGSFGEVRV